MGNVRARPKHVLVQCIWLCTLLTNKSGSQQVGGVNIQRPVLGQTIPLLASDLLDIDSGGARTHRRPRSQDEAIEVATGQTDKSLVKAKTILGRV